MTKRTKSPEETKALAAKFAAWVLEHGPVRHGATVIALYGDLGAGKTTFIQGFFKGLGIRRAPASPTFILMRHTRLRSAEADLRRGKARRSTRRRLPMQLAFKELYHLDAYRLRSGDLKNLELPALFENPRNLFLIEWPEHVEAALPRHTLRARFYHGRTERERVITLPDL